MPVVTSAAPPSEEVQVIVATHPHTSARVHGFAIAQCRVGGLARGGSGRSAVGSPFRRPPFLCAERVEEEAASSAPAPAPTYY